MARAPSDLPHNYPDRAMRDALLDPDNLRALVRAVAPDLADRLDYSRLEVVGKPYFLDDWRSRDRDILVRLPFRDAVGGEVLVCILIEHQSDADPVMPLRMLVYAVFYWEQEWKAWEDQHQRGQELRLTPIVPIVLHTGPQPWDKSRALADLFNVPPEIRAWLPTWAMPIWDLPTHTVEELVRSDDAFWQALAVVRAERSTQDEFLAALRQALTRMEPLGTQKPVRWHQLLRMVLHWGLFRRPRREHQQVLETARDSHATVQLRSEVEKMSQLTEKTWEEELTEKLTEKFLKEGELRAYRATLRKQLEQRFQTLPEELLRRIAAAEAESLIRALDAVMTVSSPNELNL